MSLVELDWVQLSQDMDQWRVLLTRYWSMGIRNWRGVCRVGYLGF